MWKQAFWWIVAIDVVTLVAGLLTLSWTATRY